MNEPRKGFVISNLRLLHPLLNQDWDRWKRKKQHRENKICQGQTVCCPMRRVIFPKPSSNISYLVKGTLKFYFCKFKEHPVLLIFSHFAKLMPVEAKKEYYSKPAFQHRLGNTKTLQVCTVSPDHWQFTAWKWLQDWTKYQGVHLRGKMRRESGSFKLVMLTGRSSSLPLL